MIEESKKTLVVGGSMNPDRFSNRAIRLLLSYDHQVVSIGLREGEVENVQIQKGKPPFKDIHTITLYVGPKNQPPLYEYLIGLKPKRIIFNPGTENETFEMLADENQIETIRHCTLVMLAEGSY